MKCPSMLLTHNAVKKRARGSYDMVYKNMNRLSRGGQTFLHGRPV